MVTKLTPHPVKKHKEEVREDFGPPPVFPEISRRRRSIKSFPERFWLFSKLPSWFLKSSVALNNSGHVIAMKYGFSQGKSQLSLGGKVI